MPKMKSKKALACRFKLTGRGKLVHQRAGLRHILTKKTSKRKRQLARPGLVSDALLKTYKRCMCV